MEPIAEPELMAKFEGKNVVEQVVRFFRTNHVRRFMLKRPFHRGQKDKTNEYKTLHVECIVYTTAHRFPSILRWFEVKCTEVVSRGQGGREGGREGGRKGEGRREGGKMREGEREGRRGWERASERRMEREGEEGGGGRGREGERDE